MHSTVQPRPIVLVVEDEPTLQTSMRRALERSGLAVRTAFDYRKAIAQLNDPPPAVVCIDLCLPDQSGYELCQHIRRTPGCLEVPILVTGNGAFPEHMAHAERAGANAFLVKPFHLDRLVATVESLLDRIPASTVRTTYQLRGS